MAQAIASDTLSDRQRERLDIIRQSGEALLAILNDVLDISKIEAGRLELEDVEFELGELLLGAHSAFTALANKRGLSFALNIAEPAKGCYRGDPTRVRQIVYNLISNALKFTPSGEVRGQRLSEPRRRADAGGQGYRPGPGAGPDGAPVRKIRPGRRLHHPEIRRHGSWAFDLPRTRRAHGR